ncbi:hypothetical protein D3C78_1625090 [compost metagenome]
MLGSFTEPSEFSITCPVPMSMTRTLVMATGVSFAYPSMKLLPDSTAVVKALILT